MIRWGSELGEFARRLSEARRRKRLSQREVAAALHLSVQTLSRWEQGKHEPGVILTARLAELYGVSVDWLTQLATDPSGLTPGTWIVDRRLLRDFRCGSRESSDPGQAERILVRIPNEPEVVGSGKANEIRNEIESSDA